MKELVIIGGGLSGTLLAMRTLQRAQGSVRVTLIERKARQLTRGVAYSSRLNQQLLNVPVCNMSLFPEDPTDLLVWLRSGPLPKADPLDMVPRTLYGDYVCDRFHACQEEHRGTLRIVHGEAVELDHHPAHGYRIRLDDGSDLHGDLVVLALGHAPPAHVPGLDPVARKHPGYVPWPWAENALRSIEPDDEVMIVGTGLTMVDLLFSLRARGHRGSVTVLSRNGRFPLPHALGHSWRFKQPLPKGALQITKLMRWVRQEVVFASLEGIPWQAVMDQVKTQVRGWWTGMDMAERARFIRHVRPLWEVHRHRMPLEVHARLQHAQNEGWLEHTAARIQQITVDEGRLRVRYTERSTGDRTERWTKHLINCTGPQSDTRRMDQPLLIDMLAAGFIVWDPLHLGIHTDTHGAVIGPSGRPSPDLYAIGPLCKPSRWESTAVPEIRVQATELAERIAQRAQDNAKPAWLRAIARSIDHLTLHTS